LADAFRPWTIIMLTAGGLFTGGLVWYAWERIWIWHRLDLGEFAVDFRRSVRRADPAMPILLMICGAAAGVFASIAEGVARTLALAGTGLLAVILVASIVVAEPINSQFRRLPDGVVPPQAERPPATLATIPPHPRLLGRRGARVPHRRRHLRWAKPGSGSVIGPGTAWRAPAGGCYQVVGLVGV
jgi:hypothetical protein